MKKKTLVNLQFLIAVLSSFLLLFNKGQIVEGLTVYCLIGLIFASAFVLTRIPERIFEKSWFDSVVLLADTGLISLLLAFSRHLQWDLLLFYFFILFLAAIADSLKKSLLGFLVVAAIYIAFQMRGGWAWQKNMTELFIRLHFLFGLSLLYGYLASNAKEAKQRADEAEKRERLKMNLVLAIAHDIKNPLGAIAGFTEHLLNILKDSAQNETLQFLAVIQRNAQKIVQLVTGFLEAGKETAVSADVVREPVDLGVLLAGIRENQIQQLKDKNLECELHVETGLPKIMGNPHHLERVFWNLATNAMKFTPAGGRLTISALAEGDRVRVDVKDTGMGIAQDQIPLLFNQFRRLNNSSHIEGTGLGLFIVKTIVEAHRGSVQVTSVEGKGATFSVFLPVK